MDEPPKLRDHGRELFRHARKSRPMTTEERARTTWRVGRLGATTVALGSVVWLQGAAWGAGLGLVAVAAANYVPELMAPPTPARSAQAPHPTPPAARVAAEVHASSPERSAQLPEPHVPPKAEAPALPAKAPVPDSEVRPPTPESPDAEAPRESDSLAEEAALLNRAQAAIASSPAEALAIAEAHAARFPHGKLTIEREIVMVDALRRQGRVAEARALGEAALVRAKGSLYEARIRKLIDGTP
jgi:hypothetical protein